MSMSKENLSSPAAGSKARRGKDDVGVSDAMKRQKEVFQEKLRRVSAAQKPNSGKSKTLRNKNLSGPAKKPEPICKGKSYRSKDDRKLKEKDPNSKNIQIKKYVLDSKPGGRSSKASFSQRTHYRLGSERFRPRPDRPFGHDWEEEEERPSY